MKMPKPTADATTMLERLVAKDPRLEVKKVFGQPAAFANGNMCFGTFGADVFLRLGEADQKLATSLAGVRPFEPMAGRPMKGYFVFPRSILQDRKRSREWVERSIRHALTLPPKKPKTKRS